MSHAPGLVLLPNGQQYLFEYDGTADICCTRLYNTMEELNEHWRKDNMRECTCGDKLPQIEVILSTSYGGWHFLWRSEICIVCMAITGETHDNFY